MKPWIDFNTEKRKQAKSDFEKDMFKLMNNAVMVRLWRMLEIILTLNWYQHRRGYRNVLIVLITKDVIS